MPIQSDKEMEADIRKELATRANIKIISERLRNNDLSVLKEGYKQHELSIAHLYNTEQTLQVIANKLKANAALQYLAVEVVKKGGEKSKSKAGHTTQEKIDDAISKEANKQLTPKAIAKSLLPDLKELYKEVSLDSKYQLLPLFFSNRSGKMDADCSPFLGDTEFIDPLRAHFVKLLEKDGLNLENLKQEYLEEFPYSYKLPIGSLDSTEWNSYLSYI